MTFKNPLPDDLQNRVKPCPIDFLRVENFLKRAKKDLASADRIRDSDLEGSYQLLYDAMLHSAMAFMIQEGVQPDIRGKHKTLVDFAGFRLGKDFKSKIDFYDRMRRRRHQFLYEPGPYACTEKEIEDARKVALDFIGLISKEIQGRNPQQELNFNTS